MIPGRITRVIEATIPSADTIKAFTDVLVLTGTVTLNTILPGRGNGNESQLLILLPQGIITIGTTGNILFGTVTVVNRPVILIWSKSLQKWSIVAGA